MKSKLRTNYKFLYIAQILLMLLVFAMGASLLMPRISVYAEGDPTNYQFDLKVKMLGPGGEDLGLLKVGGGDDYSLTIKVTGTTEDQGFPDGNLTFSYLTEPETWESLDLAGLQGLLEGLEMPVFTEIEKSGGDSEIYDPLTCQDFSYGDVNMAVWETQNPDILSDLYNEAQGEGAGNTAYITANYVESDWIEAEIDIKLTAKSGGNIVGSSTVEDALIVSGIKG